MKVQLEQWGDATVAVLPPALAERLGARDGGTVEATVEEGGVTLRLSPPLSASGGTEASPDA